jgi:hypothetical protein
MTLCAASRAVFRLRPTPFLAFGISESAVLLPEILVGRQALPAKPEWSFLCGEVTFSSAWDPPGQRILMTPAIVSAPDPCRG